MTTLRRFLWIHDEIERIRGEVEERSSDLESLAMGSVIVWVFLLDSTQSEYFGKPQTDRRGCAGCSS
jgi:hypothetical protein